MGLLSSNGDGDHGSLFVDINVTPLVDVMLVLLIIFMVTAPFMMETIGVNLPKGDGAPADNNTAPLTISIDKDGQIIIANERFTLDGLEGFLKDNPRIQKGEAVFIEADEHVSHGEVARVMAQAYKAGVGKLNIIMEKP